MRLICCCFFAFLLVPAGLLWANQLPSALLESIYPPSGTKGVKVDVAVKGTYLEGAQLLQFSDPSIKATPKKNENGELVANAFVVEIPANLAVGRYSVSVGGGKFGHSNARSFIVNDLPETSLGEVAGSMESAPEVKLGHTMIGFPKASNYGWMKIALEAKQRVVIESEGRHTDSQFSPCLAVLDESGSKLASSTRTGFLVFEPKRSGQYYVRLHDFLFKGGEQHLFRVSVTKRPRIHFVDPPLVRIGQARRAVVYGWNLPGGKPAGVELPGNLPLERLETSIHLPGEKDLNDPIEARDPLESTQVRHDYRVSSPAGKSLPFSLVVCPEDWTKEIPENEEFVKLTPPCEFLGSFFPARDRDRFRFEAKKGDSFNMEIFCERMGFPSHPYLLVEQVTAKADGSETRKTVAQSDKTVHPSSSSYLYLSSRDPSLRFTAPADGTFEVLAYDMFRVKGNPFKSYRFSVRRESPDFGLMAHPFLPPPANNKSPVYPRSPTLRPGESLPIRVAVDRRDGFEGEIKLSIRGLPEGIDYAPRVLPRGENSVVVLLRTDKRMGDKSWSGKYSISGTAMIDGKAVARTCGITNLCWSRYNTQSKLAFSKLRMGKEGNLAFLPGREAPIDLAVNWKKMDEQAKELIDKTEKAIKSLRDSQTKSFQVKEHSEKEVNALAKSLETFLKEKEQKQKRVKTLTETEIPQSRETLKIAEEELAKAEGKRSQKDINPEQLAGIEDSLRKAKAVAVGAAAKLKTLTEEQSKANQALKSTYSTTELKKREQELTKARTNFEKNAYSWNKEKAKLSNRNKVLARAKLKAAGFAKRIENPGTEPLVLVATLGGTLNLPVSLEAKDKSFAAPTKVRVMGMTVASKIKEITIDPKKKKEGDLAINLTQAKFPEGEFNLVCLAQGKGKYKLYDEFEKNATELEAKEINDSVAALKKSETEARKKLDLDKKNLTEKKAQLQKAGNALTLLERESDKLVDDLEKVEKALIRAVEAGKNREATQSVDQSNLAALQKSAASLKQKKQAHENAKIGPAKSKKQLVAGEVLKLEESIAKAQPVHSELTKKLKRMEDKKKKTDARLKLVKDDFAKPKDLSLAHFDLPFVLRVKKAPFVFEDMPSLVLNPGKASSLPVQIDRDNDFEDPITLKLILPKGIKGISQKIQNIEKSECLGEIRLSSQGEASEGKHNCTVEASFKYKNQNLKLSQAFELTVLPAPKKPS